MSGSTRLPFAILLYLCSMAAFWVGFHHVQTAPTVSGVLGNIRTGLTSGTYPDYDNPSIESDIEGGTEGTAKVVGHAVASAFDEVRHAVAAAADEAVKKPLSALGNLLGLGG